MIWFIELPMMLPAIVIAAFIRFIDSFRVFDHIFVLTGGGPGNKTTSISIYIYKLFFNQNALGEAVAVSIHFVAHGGGVALRRNEIDSEGSMICRRR